MRRPRSRGAALVVAASVVLVACGGDGDSSDSAPVASVASEPAPTGASTSERTTTSVEPDLPEVQDVPGSGPGALSIASRPFPDWVTITGDSAWVANAESGVARYDRMTGALLGSVPTGPTVCLAMDATADALWVGNCETTALVRIDVATGEIAASIPLPFTSIAEESSVAAGPDGVFVLGDEGTIARVDPATNAVASTFAAPVGSSALRSSPGALWVTSAGPGMLRKLDPTTGSMLEEIKVGSGSRFLAVGEGAVWVQNNGDGTVSRVDLESEEVVATVTVSDLQIDGGDIAVGGGYVWARVSADSLVAQIDPATNVVVARYGPANGSGSVAADDDAAWISAHDVFTVFRVPFD